MGHGEINELRIYILCYLKYKNPKKNFNFSSKSFIRNQLNACAADLPKTSVYFVREITEY